jgi:uncharacterized membrane protein
MPNQNDGSDPNSPRFDQTRVIAYIRRLKRSYIFISICAGLAALITIIQLIQDL